MRKFYTTCRTLFLSFLILCLFLNVVAQSKSNKVISITVKDGKLAHILKKIQDQVQMQIVYNGQLVDQEGLQTVVAKNEGLIQLLDRILRNTQLTYTVQNDVIILSKKPQASKIVSGTVINTDGEFLLVATITNMTTGVTTRSNEKGFFRISAEIGHRLQVSHIGYEIYDQEVRNYKNLTISLYRKEQVLEDVVLTGYQTINKRLSAGSTFGLKGSDIVEPNVSNIASMLQGKVPGLSIETNSGSPNAIPRMRVRGTSTLVGNANPIWVVDGIIREDPVNVNPDNVLGLNPSDMDKILRGGVLNASADLMGNSISGVNVNDIETITFLKDAAATSLYGTRAANGVIVITTKRGQLGKPTLNYSTNLGFLQKPSYNQLKLMNSQERIQASRELYADGFRFQVMPLPLGYDGAYIDLINRKISQQEFDQRVAAMEMQNTDWFDLLFKNSFNQTHSLSLSGGSENTSYRSSLSFGNLRGTAPNDRNDNIIGSIAMNSRINEKLSVDFSLNGAYRNSMGYYNTVNPMSYAIRTSRSIHPDTFYPAKLISYGQYESQPLEYNIFNEIAETGNLTKSNQLNAVLSIDYKIFPSLKFNSLFGGGLSTQNSEQYATERSFAVAQFRGYDYGSVIPGGPEESMSALPFGGELNSNDNNNLTYSWRNSLNFNQSLFEGRDLLTLFGAQEIKSSRYQGNSIYQHGYLKDRGESFAVLPAYYYVFQRQKQNLVENSFSVLGSATYSIAQKYILNGNIRVDASNRFGQFTNSRFLPVWSIAGRWNVDKEKWLSASSWISELVLKGSYGAQGNAVKDVGPDLILEVPVYDAIHPLAKEYILGLKSLAYPDLKWEQTKSYNAEINLGLFNNFVNIALGTYYKKTDDAISRFDIPLEYGNTKMYMNGATIVNKGIEAAINFNLIRKNDWTWQVSANTSKNSNILNKGSDIRIVTLYDYLNGNLQQTDQPLGTFYIFDYKRLNANNGLPLFNVIDDVDQPKDLDFEEYLIKAGSKHHDITGGLSSNVNYKNWGIHAHFNFSLGAMRLLNPLFKGENYQLGIDPDQNLPSVFNHRWRKPGDEAFTNIPGFVSTTSDQNVIAGGNSITRYQMYDHSTIMLAAADFLKLRNLAVSYQVPSKWVKQLRISQASIHMGVSNVFTIADKLWRGQDPEISGVGTTALPQVAAYNLSINVSF